MSALRQLLERLYTRQNWCPYCGREHVHDSGCVLEGMWPPTKEDRCTACGHVEEDT